MGAGDKGIAAFDAVGEPRLQQEVEHAIDADRRRAAAALPVHLLDQVIGPHGRGRGGEMLQDLAPDRRQLQLPFGTARFRDLQHIRGRMAVLAGVIVRVAGPQHQPSLPAARRYRLLSRRTGAPKPPRQHVALQNKARQ